MTRTELTVKVIRENLKGNIVDLEYIEHGRATFYQSIKTTLLNGDIVEIEEPEDIDKASKVSYLELDKIKLAEDFYREMLEKR